MEMHEQEQKQLPVHCLCVSWHKRAGRQTDRQTDTQKDSLCNVYRQSIEGSPKHT